jgi:SAM-dependent methyltransferase
LAKTTRRQIPKGSLETILVCPSCGGSLAFQESEAECSRCGSRYHRRGATWDFTLGESFPDEEDSDRWGREELQDANRASNYYLPFFRSMPAASTERPLRALSVGCGVAAEVDHLLEAGIECYGVDCGNRSLVWSRRTHPENLLRANGMHLPFPDGHFDIVFAGCLFPHVGVIGDTFEVRPDYWESRLQLAREMVRVCRPGGVLMISCPNRLFPWDLFHRQGSGYVPRMHSPNEQFLLSLKDFRKLFVEGCGCLKVNALPAANYWTFNELTRSLSGRLLAATIRLYLRLVSAKFFSALHGSLFAPWLVVAVRR